MSTQPSNELADKSRRTNCLKGAKKEKFRSQTSVLQVTSPSKRSMTCFVVWLHMTCSQIQQSASVSSTYDGRLWWSLLLFEFKKALSSDRPNLSSFKQASNSFTRNKTTTIHKGYLTKGLSIELYLLWQEKKLCYFFCFISGKEWIVLSERNWIMFIVFTTESNLKSLLNLTKSIL